MIKRTITFPDLDGEKVTEDFYFNFNKAELLELETSYDGGITGLIQELEKTKKGSDVIRLFKDILTRSVGKRSEDGKRFIKNKEITDYFLETEAYSTLFMQLIESPDSGAAFFTGVMPADLVAEVQASEAAKNVQLPAENVALDEEPWITEQRDPTQAEFAKMNGEQMARAFQAKNARHISEVANTSGPSVVQATPSGA